MTRSPFLQTILLVIAIVAIVAIVLPLAIIYLTPAARNSQSPSVNIKKPQSAWRVVSPSVEPLGFVMIDPDDARSVNAAVPLVKGPVPAARPFFFAGSKEDFSRATDCLAAAAYYEAGDDAEGGRAVAQVVLNRLRHPAFPKTVCGVVFQGAERTTGCQFTFTCDGTLARMPLPFLWSRAREVAIAALRGLVYKPVGWATHYHTDWVVPYWSSSLDKIAQVHTHLFFRWSGWWGTAPAFNRDQQSGEGPVIALAGISDAHQGVAAFVGTDAVVTTTKPFFGRMPLPVGGDDNTFLTSLDPAQAETFVSLARASCGVRAKCNFMGWTQPDEMGAVLPLTANQVRALSFSYIREAKKGERQLWNCAEFENRRPCMRSSVKSSAPEPEYPVLALERERLSAETRLPVSLLPTQKD